MTSDVMVCERSGNESIVLPGMERLSQTADSYQFPPSPRSFPSLDQGPGSRKYLYKCRVHALGVYNYSTKMLNKI